MSFDDRPLPHNLDAERCVLGAMMLSVRAIEDVAEVLTAADFYWPAHELIYDTCLRLHSEGVRVDTTTVAPGLGRGLDRAGGSSYLHACVNAVAAATSAGYFAEIVRALAIMRRLIQAGSKAVELGYGGGDDTAGVVAAAQAEMLAISTDEGPVDVHVPTVREFLDTPDPDYDWVIPDMLERSDRLILTGAEGLGKSTLFRQLAVCIAAGVHPFKNTPIRQQRVLYVDCENGDQLVRRKIRPLTIQARRQGQGCDDTLFMAGRPEGLNLLNPADQQWLIRRVHAVQPSVLFTGSLYKLFEGDPDKEQPARMVSAVLDKCRIAGNCAVVVEAHSGHAQGDATARQVRPIGASLWLRWPEFGYGLRPKDDYDATGSRHVGFVGWRGDRDERSWPKELVAGSYWPWEEPATNRWGVAS